MKATIQYNAALEEIQRATQEGKIKWIRNRPESFKYKTMNDDLEDLILTIQRVGEEYYLSLVKKDFESTEVLLNIDTSETEPDLKIVLEELYNLIEYHVDLQNLDGLNQFIDIINHEKTRKNLFD